MIVSLPDQYTLCNVQSLAQLHAPNMEKKKKTVPSMVQVFGEMPFHRKVITNSMNLYAPNKIKQTVKESSLKRSGV